LPEGIEGSSGGYEARQVKKEAGQRREVESRIKKK
jgi:hypothetical protein